MSNPDPALERCTEESTGSTITVRARGRFAAFRNSDRAKIKKIDVDCWMPSNVTVKTDYIVCKPGMVDVFVELKGKDIDHAVEQILATAAKWKVLPVCATRLGAVVVFTRSPKRSAALDNMKLKMFQKHRTWIEMDKCGAKEYDFVSFTGSKR